VDANQLGRRNLNSGQWATIAVEADDIMAAIAEEAKARQVRKPVDSVVQKIAQQPSGMETRTVAKAAELFNTNRKASTLSLQRITKAAIQ